MQETIIKEQLLTTRLNKTGEQVLHSIKLMFQFFASQRTDALVWP